VYYTNKFDNENASGYGTVLFFEDQQTLQGWYDKMPFLKEVNASPFSHTHTLSLHDVASFLQCTDRYFVLRDSQDGLIILLGYCNTLPGRRLRLKV
jgi:hypothetical protein